MTVRTELAQLTTTEAAVLALLAIEGERSAYDLDKLVRKAIGHVWSPARSQLYAVLPRLERDWLARSRAVAQASRPDKRVYRLTKAGRRALEAWLARVEPGDAAGFHLKAFVGELMPRETLVAHYEQFRDDAATRLANLRAIEPTNTGEGHDFHHRFLLRYGIERAEHDVAWAESTLRALRRKR
jgi:DNA-binding PadR family transcriptional regulator